MPKLTQNQLRILSKASQRNDHAVDPPPRLRGAALKRTIAPLLSQGFLREVAAGDRIPSWRRDDALNSFALIVTKAGLAEIGHLALRGRSHPPRKPSAPSSQIRSGHGTIGNPKGWSGRNPHLRAGTKLAQVRASTKLDQIRTLLARSGGAAIDDLVQVTGWLPHSVRAALTGLRKRGYAIKSEPGPDRKSRYRLLARKNKQLRSPV